MADRECSEIMVSQQPYTRSSVCRSESNTSNNVKFNYTHVLHEDYFYQFYFGMYVVMKMFFKAVDSPKHVW